MEVQLDITGNARAKQITLSHNRSGNFTFNLPLTIEYLEYTKTNQYCIIAMKNNTIVWSGPLWTRSIDLLEEKITLSAVGWFEILMNRYLRETVPDYSDVPTLDSSIGHALLGIANTDVPTYITTGLSTGSTNRTIKYEIFQSIGEEIINLSDTENGFDIYVDPETRELNLYDNTDYVDRTSIPFGMNHGVNNISNIVINENGGEMRNRIQVVGANNDVYEYDSLASQATNGLMTEVIQLTESDDATLLQAIANAQGAIKENGMIDYELTLKPEGESNPYEIFEDYDIGDRIYITAQKYIDGETVLFTHEPRIFGATIDIDEYNTERVSSLQTTFSGA